MRACAPLVLLLLLLQLSTLQSTVAFSPLDSATQNVAINATLSSLALASSQTSFIPTQTPVIKLDSLWVSCGIDNRGSVASIRVYIDLASDSVQVYFEFVRVYAGWRGVAHGRVDYQGASYSAWLDPTDASSTGVSVHLADNIVTASGGGFNSVVRAWAEGSDISVYVGECQYGISFEGAQNGSGSASASPLAAMASIALGLVAAVILVVIIARRVLPARTSPRICRSCGFSNPPYTKSFCTKCGKQLEAYNDKPHRMVA